MNRVVIYSVLVLAMLRSFTVADETRVKQAEHECWRMMPVKDVPAFAARVAAMAKETPTSEWLGVYRLYLAAMRDDRQALVAAAGNLTVPAQYPTVWAEEQEMPRLIAAGQTEAAAGLHILGQRSYEPLHGLLDLDRILTREADHLEADDAHNAAKLRKARDELRAAYVAMSRNLVERLFALILLGKKTEAEALRARAARLEYLADSSRLAAVLSAMDESQAWSLLIQPLVRSELAVIDNPPDLRTPATRPAEQLTIESRSKAAAGAVTTYEGDVRITLGKLSIACDRLAVMGAGDDLTLNGIGQVRAGGLGSPPQAASADRFTFDPRTGELTLGGDVRIAAMRARHAVVDRRGAVIARRTLIDDFAETAADAERLALAKKIAAIYPDEDLKGDVRYWAAMALIQPHLAWHAQYDAPKNAVRMEEMRQELKEAAIHVDSDEWRWTEAHAGEAWMRPNARAAFWRLKEPGHADIARAISLLGGVREGELAQSARHWAAELRRNNTVITFDVAGGYEARRDAHVLMDVRSAERVSFKLYRVREPGTLLAATGRIGEDFIFRDHGVLAQQAKMHQLRAMRDRQSIARRTLRLESAQLADAEIVARWESAVAEMEVFPAAWWPDDWDEDQEDDEAWYYGDDCSQFAERLDREYHPHGRPSSWQCDRVVRVPGKALEAGAYILAAKANGQTAYAPVIVDPLSLVLRRCRDGVFAVVSDVDGRNPAAGARLLADGMLGECVADAQGAAFARVFAAGERAIVAHKDGHFAIGGFGRVFDGIYRTAMEEPQFMPQARARLQRAIPADAEAQVYADRFVVAAYSDRPTYRPGQEVQFKLIVRKLLEDAQIAGGGFRASEFEARANLALPAGDAPIHCEVFDSKGREVSSAELKLNDFGTAAGSVKLSEEAATGNYTLRVTLAGVDRLVPDVFQVKYYRRPNFRVTLTANPEEIAPGKTVKLQVAADYYFGKPVAGTTAHLRIVRLDDARPLVQAEVKLDNAGKASMEQTIPADTPGGECFAICDVADASGRTVSASARLLVVRLTPFDGPKIGLSSLPRFMALGDSMVLKVAENVKVAERGPAGAKEWSLQPQGGQVKFAPNREGWYRLACGSQSAIVFVHGTEEPDIHPPDVEPQQLPRWVDLTHYAPDADGESGWLTGRERAQRVLALFDRQHVKAGSVLRVLVYASVSEPRFLFTFEGRTVMDYLLVSPKGPGPYHIIDIPIKDRHAPNFYLQARVIASKEPRLAQRKQVELALRQAKELPQDGEDPDWCRVDVLGSTHRGEQTLKVDVTPQQQNHRPDDEVNVAIRVTDLDGKPASAEVSLAAVDQSVYAFGEDALDTLPGLLERPRSLTRFYPKSWRAGQLIRIDQRMQLQRAMQAMAMQQAMMEMARKADAALAVPDRPGQPLVIPGERPATSLDLARLRLDFRETAAWRPQLRTDAEGMIRTSFTLPDSLTEYRLSAVALTKDTRLGVGRSQVKASQPLSVQVFLPRFAVEGDRLLGVALIHNSTPKPMQCQVRWDVDGATLEGEPAETIDIAANASARATRWLKLDRIGAAKAAVRAGDADHADAEQRELRIQPMGRPRELSFSGAFERAHRLALPAGYVADDLRITLTRRDASAALEGLGYLVEYPHGCVEQTMSRFLPAVVVKSASQQVELNLPPDVVAKLPDVLSRGLARLYNFQHADGAWGWFQNDARNDAMTVYVLDGLARCRAAGVAVDAAVLSRGCAYLKSRLPAIGQRDELDARAWLALALAGQADAGALAGAAQSAGRSAEARCLFALACRHASKPDLARRLWNSARDWQPVTSRQLALKLAAQVQFIEPLADCHATAYKLLDLRQGERWENTQSTAAAIEALSSMLRYTRGEPAAKHLLIRVGGKAVLDVRREEDLKAATHRLRLLAGEVPPGDALPIELLADCERPIQFAITATGTQRMDRVEPSGTEVKLSREFTAIDGQPLTHPLKPGEIIAVRLRLDLTDAREYLLINDPRPAGFEYVEEHLHGPPAAHVEFRDDRITAFHQRLPAGRHDFVYYLRAETPGTSHILPAHAYPMYDEKKRGESAAQLLTVSP